MHTLNLGVLAHVDAGKTSLTERLLYSAGVIDHLGRVDDGTTQTDSLALERRRGITIRSAVASFAVGDTTVNLIDTPGHPDFIAEVERALAALDAVILVISAVEGVQAQTRVLMRALHRLTLPVVIFVNKIDRAGADPDRVLAEIRRRLCSDVVAMGCVVEPGSGPSAGYEAFRTDDPALVEPLAQLVAEHDDAVLAGYLDDDLPPDVAQRFARLVGRGQAHPVFAGSAVTGAGVAELIDGVTAVVRARPVRADTATGTVFKIDRGAGGDKICYVRMFSGTIAVRDRISVATSGERRRRGDKITALQLYDRGPAAPAERICAGQIGRVWGLDRARVGDRIGSSNADHDYDDHLALPPLESVVRPVDDADHAALFAALTRLAEQDPLINVRSDDVRRELSVSLYGEVQKEVIEATLAEEYAIAVTFAPTTAVCIERPARMGEAIEQLRAEGNPFLAGVGVRVEPAPVGAGIRYEVAGDMLGTMPLAFFRATEDTVRRTLEQGLAGWSVTDCAVTLIHTGYQPRQSHAHASFDKSMSSTGADFRGLTPLVIMAAVQRAGTLVCEPVHRFDLDVPADTVGSVLGGLPEVGAVPESTDVAGERAQLNGTIPAGSVHRLQQLLPGLTRGEGDLATGFDSYRPVRGPAPRRDRVGVDPLDRRAYLLSLGIRH